MLYEDVINKCVSYAMLNSGISVHKSPKLPNKRDKLSGLSG